jgi:CPA1 family monovalent cation:H+ antiporter
LVGLPLGTEEFALSTTFARFCTFVGIGIGIGCLVGFGISFATQRFDLPLVEQSLTLVSAYGTYLIVEELGGSGVIGVVTVGLILGNFGSRIGMNPRTRLIVSEFWDFIAFFVNSIVFLLIGDQINFGRLEQSLNLIGVTIGAVLLTRAIAIYGLGALSNGLANSKIGWREQTVLWWGGLRGSVSVALALSVPVVLDGRQDIIDAVFGVVLFTLLVQGLTTQVLLEKLNLIGDQPIRQKYSEALARRVALNRVQDYLTEAARDEEIDTEFAHYQKELVQAQLEGIQKEIDELLNKYPQLQTLGMEQIREKMLDIEADTYAEFIRAGRLNERLSPLMQQILVQADESLVELERG